jgi:uncharacterized protein (TIGR02231 family)
LNTHTITTRLLVTTACLLAVTTSSHADEPGRIVAATVYLQGAAVERELKVPGGTRHVVMNCVPDSAEVTAVRIDGAPDVRVGEIVSEPLVLDEARACTDAARDPRIKRWTDRKVVLENRVAADQVALDYLKRWSQPLGRSDTPPAPATTPSTASAAGRQRVDPALDADTLRLAARNLLDDQAQAQAELATLKAALEDLSTGTRAVTQANTSDWATVRFDVATAAPATLRLRYHVDNVSWKPAYRATLDVDAATLLLDRMAIVLQNSGETWTDVALTLSTTDPSGKAQGPLPRSWTVGAQRPEARAPLVAGSSLQRVEITGGMIQPEVDLAPKPGSVDQRAFETLFKAAHPVTFTATTHRHDLVLETVVLPVTLRARVAPRQDPRAWLLVDAPRPPGIWPVGTMSLLRDGQYAGDARWGAGDDERMLLPFGRDERIRVVAEHPTKLTADRGLFGGHLERRWADAYTVTNLHAAPSTVEVVDALPVSIDEKVKVTTVVKPEPTLRDWKALPGVASWTFTLAPRASQRIEISNVVEWPSDMTVTGLEAN